MKMPDEVKLSFSSEEERAKAMEELPETPENIEKLREIRDAAITEKTEDGEPKPEGEVKPEGEREPEQQEIPDESNFSGYKSLGELRKAFDEQKALIQRQQGFIREKLQSQQEPIEDERTQKALERAEKAERELAEMKQAGTGSQTEKKETTAEITSTQQELQRIDELFDELDEMVKRDPDLSLDPDFRKKEFELQRLQRKTLGDLNNLYVQAMNEVRAVKDESAKIRSTTDEYVNTSKKVELTRRQEEAKAATIREMDGIAKIPEFKEYDIGKSYSDAEQEYVKFRNDVALAYYGRPARTRDEGFVALDQLQLKNPELISKLQMMGIKAEPTQEVSRYIELCEALDYMEGWRNDPVTGRKYRLTRHDPATGANVPLVMPSLKDALQKMRLDNGYYANERDNAYQQGAEALASAAQRRDSTVKELNDGASQGQIGNKHDVEWAMKILDDESIEMDAMKKYRAGDTTAFDEINKAREIVGMAPMSIDT